MKSHRMFRRGKGWACTCGVRFATDDAVTDHAFTVQGSIDMGAKR